jgi:Putative beta-barrel porin-2, OmpL-like. bbp2
MKKICVVVGMIGAYVLSGGWAALNADDTNLAKVITAPAPSKIAPKTLEFLEGTEISGYVQASYQKAWGASGTAGTPGTVPARVFDNNRNAFDVDQVKITLEKPLGDGETGAGYRVDLLYGSTAAAINGGGNPNSNSEHNFLLEQAYVAFRVPVGSGVDVKFGRFDTLLGNEVIDAPGNWNYSRSYIFNSEPLTHIGALMSYTFSKADDKTPVGVDAQLGIVNGYGDTYSYYTTAVNNSENNSGKAVTGRVGVTLLGGQLVFSTIGIAGAEHNGNNNGTKWAANEVVTYNPKWNEKWSFALEAIYGRDTRMDTAGLAAPAPEAMWWGVAGYTKYQWLTHFSTALRVESFNFNGSAENGDMGWNGVLALPNGGKGHVEDITLSCSFDNIWKNLTPRIEARYDRSSPAIFGNTTDAYHNGILTLSLDVIYAF